MLRVFDNTYDYGPCVGMTRLERWERAEALGLNPPAEVFKYSIKDFQREIFMTHVLFVGSGHTFDRTRLYGRSSCSSSFL